jgi:tetratricopeptide (TPR) repeat protein
MSLLLEALKKAERAKEEAQRRARGESGSSTPITLAEGSADKHVVTRDELPDISQPLDIHSDDIRPIQVAPEPESVSTRNAPPVPPKKSASAAREPEPQANDRAAARKVFEAKFKEPNPQLPFFITMGLLGAMAVGTVGYFWYQLRPPAALVNTNQVKSTAQSAVEVAANPAAGAAAPAAQPSIPGLPGSVPPPPLPQSPAVAGANPGAAPVPPPAGAAPPIAPPQPAPTAVPGTGTRRDPPPAATRRTAETAPRAGLERDSGLSVSRAAPQVHPRVDAAYSAYLGGDMAAARIAYEEAVREQPSNRDALLGLAAVDIRSGRLEAAEATYMRLLQADPRDAHAQAGLIALRSGRMDPVVAESRVKTLLAAEPGAHVLNFTLGNQLAQQGRWGEAQQQYFKAYAAEPENADFAYNLAVSLDHLRQPKPALDYYRRALALAEKRGASFDAEAARDRITQLAR